MMWQEFEMLAGYEVSYETFTKVIEPMYMATEMSKEDFVKCLNKKAFALPTRKQMVSKMRKLAKEIADEAWHSGAYELKGKLNSEADAFYTRFYDDAGCGWYYFNTETTMPNGRGCSYPVELVLGSGDEVFERIELIKM